jgi:Flp pilus assembly protein TadD
MRMMSKFVFRRSRFAAAIVGLLCGAVLTASGCGHRTAADYIKAGDQALHDNQLGSAQEDYETAVKLAPDNPRTHMKLGDLYLFEHNYPAAEVEYIKVAGLKPLDPQSHAALAKLYAARAQWGSAENQMRAAVALAPYAAEYRRELATVLNQRHQTGQAEVELRTAVGLAPADAKLHLALANFLSTLPNQSAGAEEEYARVRQLDPGLMPGGPGAGPAVASAPPGTSITPAPGAATGTAPAAGTIPPAGTAAAKPMKMINRRYLLTHNSPVYQNPDANSAVLGQVHRRRRVRVTGLTGDWLQVTLRNGTVGFIPTSAAE